MTATLPLRRSGRPWGDALGFAAIGVVGLALAPFLFSFIDSDALPWLFFRWYVVLLSLGALCLAPLLLLRGRPEARVRGESVGVSAWAPEWWWRRASDGGLVLIAVTGVVELLAMPDGDGLLAALVLGAAGAYVAVYLGLSLTGRRRRQAVWLTEGRVVHDSARGRRSLPSDEIEQVWALVESDSLLVRGSVPVTVVTRCPRLWGGRSPKQPDNSLAIDCSLLGHASGDLAEWLAASLGLPEVEAEPGGAYGDDRRFRRPGPGAAQSPVAGRRRRRGSRG